MFEPPVYKITRTDLVKLINKLRSQNRLDMPLIFKYLSLKKDLIGEINFGEIVLQRGDSYLDRIEGKNVPEFIFTYYHSIDENQTKEVIFLVMYICAFKKYSEMMSFQRFISYKQVMDIFHKLNQT